MFNEDLNKLLDPCVCEANLKLLWAKGVHETRNLQVENENMRYAAYNLVYVWLYGRRKGGRVPLPSCLVKHIRMKYPSQEYVGYIPSLFAKK